MDGVALLHHILLGQDLPVALDYVAGVLLEEIHEPQVEFFVSLDGVGGVLDCLDQASLLDVHCLHAVPRLLFLKLVVHHFLEVHALEAQEGVESFKVAFVSKDVEAVEPIIVSVELMEDAIAGSAHFHHQVHSNVRESQVATEQNSIQIQMTYQAISTGVRPP